MSDKHKRGDVENSLLTKKKKKTKIGNWGKLHCLCGGILDCSKQDIKIKNINIFSRKKYIFI